MADFYLDIETVRQYKEIEDAPKRVQELFAKRFYSEYYQSENPGVTIEERYRDQAGLTAEFGKIVCLSVSWYNKEAILKTRNFTGPEIEILQNFNKILTANKCRLIAHNGKKFDFPIITRRLIIHELPVLIPLNAYNKKPWEMFGILDTVDMWASTEYNPFISLDVLCEVLGVDSPKDGPVTGATVGDFYWSDPEQNIVFIAEYCGKDTIALAGVHKKLEKMLAPPQEG